MITLGILGAITAISLLLSITRWTVPTLALYFIWLAFEDAIRKELANNILIYACKWILLGAITIQLLKNRNHIKVPKALTIAIIVWGAYILVDSFNPNLPHPVMGFLGFHGDLMYFVLLFAANAILRDRKRIRTFWIIALTPSLAALGVALYQHMVDPYFLNREAIATAELWRAVYFRPIPGIAGKSMLMAPSLFADPGRYARYALFTFWTALSLAPLLGWKWTLVFIGAGGGGMMLAGPRFAPVITGVALTLIMVSLVITSLLMRASREYSKIVLKFVMGGIIGIGIAIFIMYLSTPQVLNRSYVWFTSTLIGTEGEPSEIKRRFPGYWRSFRVILEQGLFGEGSGSQSLGKQYLKRYFRISVEMKGEQGYAVYTIQYGLLGFTIRMILFLIMFKVLWDAQALCRRGEDKWVVRSWFYFFGSYFVIGQFLGAPHLQDYLAQSFLWTMTGVNLMLPEVENIETQEDLEIYEAGTGLYSMSRPT